MYVKRTHFTVCYIGQWKSGIWQSGIEIDWNSAHWKKMDCKLLNNMDIGCDMYIKVWK